MERQQSLVSFCKFRFRRLLSLTLVLTLVLTIAFNAQAQLTDEISSAAFTHPSTIHLTMSRGGANPRTMSAAASGDPISRRLMSAISHGASHNRRMARTQAVLGSVVSLHGCPFSVFTMPITISGNTFQLWVDTGSSTMAVAGSACTACTGVSPLWQNTSGVSVNQNYNVKGQYGDGSGWTGQVWSDVVSIGFTGNVSELTSVTSYHTSMRFAVITNQSIEGRMADGTSNPTATTFFV